MEEVGKNAYQLIGSRPIYENPWIHVREDKVIFPNGNDGIFGIVEMKTGSTVLAINDQNIAYLVKEYKYGIGKESIELVSGGLDGLETPLEGAKRELKEEVGLEAAKWIDLKMVDPFTTIVHAPNHMFLALEVNESTPCPEEWEKLEVIKVPFEKVVKMVMNGEITHSASCVCILKAEKILQEIKDKDNAS